ncbi:unnamed protein product, partial [Brenthis ino]
MQTNLNYKVYGLTEMAGAVFQSYPNDSMQEVSESVGYISDNTEVKVVDNNGKIVPYGTAGELMVRGYCNLLQYWEEPEMTRMALEDGWFHTGDEFKISREGYGTILSRIKDIIIRGGENIAPKEVEDCLQTHPDIIECQVIGVPDERLGEELCAIVRVRESAQITLRSIKSHCSVELVFSMKMLTKALNLLTTFKNPIHLKFVRQLRTDNGSYLHNPGSEPVSLATLGDVIAETAHKYPDRIAIRSIHEDVTITYEELISKADSIGCAFRANGFEKGDRIGIWLHNSSGWVTSLLGAARAGLISVLINPLYQSDELRFCINKTKLKGILIGDNIKNVNYDKVLHEMLPELHLSREWSLQSGNCPSLKSIITTGKEKLHGVTTLNSFIDNYRNNSEIKKYSSQIKPEDGVIIMMTSGTTGTPKCVLASHFGIVNSTYFIGQRLGLQDKHQVVCLQSPMFHALGAIGALLTALRHGSTVVMPSPMFRAVASLNALCAEKCTIIIGTPTMYTDILSYLKSDMPLSLRLALTGGAPCSLNLLKEINDRLNTHSAQAYGLSETGGPVFQSLPGDDIKRVFETVGYIADHFEVKVVNDKGEMVPFDTPGELMVRGYSNMLRYWDEPETTKKVLQDDGWLHTGDKLKISREGYGTFVCRIKEIIIRGGENIAPKEVEDFLNTHPDIIESQVIGVPDERLGEEVCAVIRVREDTSVTLENIKNHCSGKIAKFKIPKIVKVVEDYPKSSSGKILKYKIKELVESGNI